MANNPYVNKVVYGNDTVMDISDTTATEGDVVSGKTFYKASGARSVGTASLDDKMTYADNGVLGAKNINGTQYTSTTTGTVVFTVNADGSIDVSGTANSTDAYCTRTQFTYNGKDALYKLSGGYSNNIYLYVYCNTDNDRAWSDSTKTTRQSLNSNGTVEPTVWLENGKAYTVVPRIQKNSGAIPQDVTLYPMLTLPTDTDTTYQPYAMTNKELTDKAYVTTDTAETDIADGDYFPFYDTSATAKRKSLWSNIKAKLKTYFDGIYHPKTTVDYSPKANSNNLVTSSGVFHEDSHFFKRVNPGVLTANSVVRIPESGTDSLISSSNIDKVIPLADTPWYDSNGNSVNRPPKYKSIDVGVGYVNITVAEYINTSCIGVEVRRFWPIDQ